MRGRFAPVNLDHEGAVMDVILTGAGPILGGAIPLDADRMWGSNR